MKKYVFKPYKELFPQLFEKEKARLASQLKQKVIIEHVGSTAVPDLGGKGIIDIAIGADEKEIEAISQQLQNLGYEFRPQFSTPDRLYFIAYFPDPEDGSRRYHLHLMWRECQEWKDMLAFRDYLRQHPEEAKTYSELKKKAAEEAEDDGAKYRKIKEPIFQKILKKKKKPRFTFKLAEPTQKTLILEWFDQDHIKQWLHGAGLQSTLDNLEKYYHGKKADYQPWIAYDKEMPFAYLITSPEGEDAITLDLFICDLNYLGKGLAVQMIHEFILSQFPDKKFVLIDPEMSNTRAVHVYKKAGFEIIGEFIATWHPVPHYQMRLDTQKLLD